MRKGVHFYADAQVKTNSRQRNFALFAGLRRTW
jgi:hypothetical protein